jgi:catechol 2,3-dioxygenase-like lactoylglutathione lyase family enzyme
MPGELRNPGRAEMPEPAEGMNMTIFLTVSDIARSRAFYTDVLGGAVAREEDPCMVKIANAWVLVNPGGGPTPDKPGITLVAPEPASTVSSFMNLRVADIQTCYQEWTAKGAQFLTPPIDRGPEIRCYLRDPDGYLIEVGQAKRGVWAATWLPVTRIKDPV